MNLDEPTVRSSEPGPREEAQALTAEFVRSVVEALDRGADAEVRAKLEDVHEADIADLLGLVGPDQRRALVHALGQDLTPEVLSELGEDVRDEVLDLMAPKAIADAVQALDTDDAVYLLQDMDEDRQQEVLSHMSEADRAAVELSLQYPEYSAGRLMQREVVAVPGFWSIGQTIDHLREAPDLPDEFFEIFIVDPAGHLLGTVPVSHIVRSPRPTLVADIMDDEPVKIPVTLDQEEVAYLFEQYSLVSAPVVDEGDRLVGMITVDDIVEVIQEAASEDLLALGGVSDEEGTTATVLEVTRGRFSWLFINLLTAILASIVIGLFGSTIQQVVALAILMPIVASMGGNAGTQTLTVAVRAISMRELTPANAMRIVVREGLVGGLNGIIFAVIMGVVGWLWFADPALGGVLAAAMIINLICAGFAGILVPLGLQRAGIDPAVSSTVFVTTVTDVVGFFVFLGLATVWHLK